MVFTYQSTVDPRKLFHEQTLTHRTIHWPVLSVIVSQLEQQLSKGLLLTSSPPKSRLGYYLEIDLWMQVSHHRLLPPTHHIISIALDQLVQPTDISHSVNVIEVHPH